MLPRLVVHGDDVLDGRHGLKVVARGQGCPCFLRQPLCEEIVQDPIDTTISSSRLHNPRSSQTSQVLGGTDLRETRFLQENGFLVRRYRSFATRPRRFEAELR